MKRVQACILLVILGCSGLIPHVAAAETYPVTPRATETVSDEQQSGRRVVIVSAKGNVDNAVEQVKDAVPSAKIRHVFKVVYGGFSLDLLEEDIDVLKKLDGIARVDDIAIYQPSLEGSIPFVGAGKSDKRHLGPGGEALTGKGVKVGVIDTGVDYEHPDLRANVKGGYDVIDEDEDPMETKADQGEPTFHGTHVAGVIAANGRIKGVAPEAEIYAYRALGPGGQGTTEQVLEAIEKAVADGVDVLNLSLGNTVNGPDWPTSLALDRAVDKGVVAVTSSGNSGPNMWTVGSPGTSAKAISVGASLPPVEIPYMTLTNEKERRLELTPLVGAKPWKLKRDIPVVEAGHGLVSDYKDVDAKGKLVLVKRGRSTFAEKMETARKAGATGILIYNNLKGSFAGGVMQSVDLIGASLSKEDGEWLLEQLDHSKKELSVRTGYEQKQDLLASFSSRGPVTETWEVKPDLVAPGVAIQSTVPKGYLGLNGTSMASPHVAGAAALLIQQHPDWNPEQVKAALMNTTKCLVDEQGREYMPHEQGAGRLQVDKALETKTLVYPSSLTFGTWEKKAPRTKRELTVTIENMESKARVYHIVPPLGELDGIEWETPFSVTVGPNEKKQVTLAADIDPALLQEGLHAGTVEITGGSDTIRLPYVLFMEEPNYPRVMAFQFVHGDAKNSYYYEYYLPGGAEESGIALFDPDTFEFVDVLVSHEHSERGMVSGELSDLNVAPGRYRALVFAKSEGVKDTIEAFIDVGEPPLFPKEG
ncbi:S8 family serine peptidase [Shouchella clausii]|uniref:Peptidase S8 n=1 Tax=Shouchella clausii TaxID=79880 RepID=A0A268NZF1_SHOCL|nr:S8 family serine peptidase [Shouchella clausii]PAE88883.1 peptidase S8 [Shouchella clausii]